MSKELKLLIGKKSTMSGFGLVSCSHGMYSSGGYDRFVYGIKGIVSIKYEVRWGDFIKK